MLAGKKEELAEPQFLIAIPVPIHPASNCHSASIPKNKFGLRHPIVTGLSQI
jgi:hypothetical protein